MKLVKTMMTLYKYSIHSWSYMTMMTLYKYSIHSWSYMTMITLYKYSIHSWSYMTIMTLYKCRRLSQGTGKQNKTATQYTPAVVDIKTVAFCDPRNWITNEQWKWGRKGPKTGITIFNRRSDVFAAQQTSVRRKEHSIASIIQLISSHTLSSPCMSMFLITL